MNDMVRQIGVVFQDVSCDTVAQRAIRATISWGGEVSLWVHRDGTAEAVCTGTIDYMRRERDTPDALVGIYQHGNFEPTKSACRQVSDDIWQHMLDFAGRNTRAGQRLRAQWMQAEAA